jgi:hypothetical protein
MNRDLFKKGAMSASSLSEAAIEPGSQKGIECAFVRADGSRCQHPAPQSGGLCYWHDATVKKTGGNLKEQLESLVREGESLEGFQLQGSDLSHVHLTHRQRAKSVNLTRSDLTRANLQDAHLFHIDLRHSSLLKADFRRANLNYAQLDGANVLGADFRETKLEHVEWGRHVLQEFAARDLMRKGNAFESHEKYAEAEESYRALSLAMADRGHANAAGRFFQSQMVMRRMQLPLWSQRRIWSKLADLICGYGEMPQRVFGFSLTVILVATLVYSFAGVTGPEGQIALSADAPLMDNVLNFLECLYFSVVTFTTVGYGEILPTGWVRAAAALEAFTGAFSISLFVVVFVKRMTR